MTDKPYLIRRLHLAGFRAYLHPQAFDFNNKRCLAIFAPNGYGKSSVVDALEFMFSKDGTLERLGIRTINNQAGIVALAHNLAEETKVHPLVVVDFAKGSERFGSARAAGPQRQPTPKYAAAVGACFAVNPIIRGHSLRRFVEDRTAEQRYEDVAGWLELAPLVNIQRNLRTLRAQVKAAASDDAATTQLDKQLAKETAQEVKQWNTAVVLDYINRAILAPLDKALVLQQIKDSDRAYIGLTRRAVAEERRVGIAELRHIKMTAEAIHHRKDVGKSGEPITAGALPAFESAVSKLSNASKTEQAERGKAANATFEAVWKAAEPLFAEGAATPEACPVCATPLRKTSGGSAAAIRLHLASHLQGLAAYAAARKALERATSTATKAHMQLVSALPGLSSLLRAEQALLQTTINKYRHALENWPEGKLPDSGALVAGIEELTADLGKQISKIQAKQGDHTYAKAKSKVDRILEIQQERILAERTQAELVKLSEAVTSQAAQISAEIRGKVQSLLNTLEDPLNDIYRQIQGSQATPIRLELPAEDETNQQRLNLVVDFAENRSGVQPSGYLSDSQIHSMALALRIAAAKQFNRGAPILALDDIVTSYDADHRRAISALIATSLTEFQIILTTHDERFFGYLKDQLGEKGWHFTRIIGLDPRYGPRFADHKVTDEMVDARWAAGESAATEMRQAEEEWLLQICRDFGVSVRIRPLERAYSYDRGELASALAAFLKEANLEPRLVPGVNNRFLSSLQQGLIENFGSHFQDAPHSLRSIGDERTRWEEFKTFRHQFVCPKCGRARFNRPLAMKRPVCSHRACEAQFAFVGAS